MGKKAKIGKARRDKFYKLAKETGYRSRAAFKLLQLNRKYGFLEKSRVCIDLCAAPGGWLQVAAQNMPVSSVIVGVDLVPIKAIPNCTMLQEDITTEKCRQALRKELQTWEADCVLNDGAPNVGKNWLHDAFQQAELTLYALKLASEFLRKGGWFVTKIFRSKDYHALMWVFNQLFKKVFATKPQASRNESAEIFVVCQGFVKPDKLDPKFLDPKHVFKDVVQTDSSSKLNLIKPEKRKKHAEGYADGDNTLHHKLLSSEFLSSDDYLDQLAECNQIELDDNRIASHPLTTGELKECLKDIKVLGKKELRNIISWRKKMVEFLQKLDKEENEETIESEGVNDKELSDMEEDGQEDEEEKLKDQVAELHAEEARELKKKRKRVMLEKRKLRDKMQLNMVIPGDKMDQTDDIELFDLQKIKRKDQLKEVEEGDMEEGLSDTDDNSEEDFVTSNKMSYSRYQEDDGHDSESDGSEVGDKDESEEENYESDMSDPEDQELEMQEYSSSENKKKSNPLVIDLGQKQLKAAKMMDLWYKKDIFSGLEGEADEDLEIEKMTQEYRKKGGVVLEKKKDKKSHKAEEDRSRQDLDVAHLQSESDPDIKSRKQQKSEVSKTQDSDSDIDSDDSDYDFSHAIKRSVTQGSGENAPRKKVDQKAGFEIVPAGEPAKRVRKLDPVGLAMGAELVKSAKRRRELLEDSYNRFTSNDEGLPDWFVKDEERHRRKLLPVTKDQVQEYKERLKAINARPIKKVAEAKARKKRKSLKKLEKIRKKAEAITETVDVTDKEKWQQIKQMYKKAGLLGKKKTEVAYVMAKKGAGKKVSRPAGVRGPFKVVDRRMKKDHMRQKQDLKKGKARKPKNSRGRQK